jgi:hypothetical protein
VNPCAPVAQKAQPTAQPTCVDTHAVNLSLDGRRTLSTALPSEYSRRNFLVPSAESEIASTREREILAFSASFRRKATGKSVIALKSPTPRA